MHLTLDMDLFYLKLSIRDEYNDNSSLKLKAYKVY